jgi:hypothetical protein
MKREGAMKSLVKAAAAISLAAVAGCTTAAEDQRSTLVVTMTGLQEVPGPGDPDGSGTVEVRADPRLAQVCWNLYARGIDAATAAHIHRGAAGTAGPPVLPLTTPDASGRSEGCATVDVALAREIAWRGHDFYVNVHDAAHPAGAIRGQLRATAIRRNRERDD